MYGEDVTVNEKAHPLKGLKLNALTLTITNKIVVMSALFVLTLTGALLYLSYEVGNDAGFITTQNTAVDKQQDAMSKQKDLLAQQTDLLKQQNSILDNQNQQLAEQTQPAVVPRRSAAAAASRRLARRREMRSRACVMGPRSVRAGVRQRSSGQSIFSSTPSLST